jgi:hypothetical protein
MKAQLFRLKSEIREELARTGRIRAEIEEALGEGGLPARYRLYTLALLLHNFYGSVENIFLRIAPVLNGGTPEGGDFHKRLLENMKTEIEQIRPPVISRETFTLLSEIMRFRHIVRHMYAFDLDAAKVEALARSVAPASDALDRDIGKFLDFIDALAAGLERP